MKTKTEGDFLEASDVCLACGKDLDEHPEHGISDDLASALDSASSWVTQQRERHA